jgi:Protein of unknown function (DUF2867).
MKKIKIQKGQIAEDSLLQKMLPTNYFDAFTCIVPHNTNITTDELQIGFWAYRPQWAISLMRLRNALVKPLKLNTDNILTKERVSNIVEGNDSNSLRLYEKTANETILYKDDKHLRFYFSTQIVSINEKELKVTVSTIVKFHNKIGRLYFAIISPFHTILVKCQFKRLINNLINTQ